MEQKYPTREQAQNISTSLCVHEDCDTCEIKRWCCYEDAGRECGASMVAMHDEIDRLHTQVANLKKDLDFWRNRVLIADASGLFHTNDAEERVIMTGCSVAVCVTCGKDMGWWCEDSPTHTCDYRQEDGTYDEDQCRYCGEPQERK